MIHYKGYEVVPRTTRRDDGDWHAEVVIEKHHADGVRERAFPAVGSFRHESEAMEAALELGRQVLDGEVPGATVEDL